MQAVRADVIGIPATDQVELPAQFIAYISAIRLETGKMDAWYAFLTDKHGLAKKPAFIGMSRGGEYAYTWATAHPDKVSCIYADNPGGNREMLAKLGDLAANDVPLLHVNGSIDPLLGRVSNVIEEIYQQFGGRISVMIKDGAGHHPHSLRNPKPMADFITQSVQATPGAVHDFLGNKVARSSFYSIANDYRDFPGEGTNITCRGPFFTDCYDRYSFELPGVEGPVNVIAPKARSAKANRGVSRRIRRSRRPGRSRPLRKDFTSSGPVFHNATARSCPFGTFGSSAPRSRFSKRRARGRRPRAGEALGWASKTRKRFRISTAKSELRSFLSKAPLLDNLVPLSKSGVPMLIVCGSLDPALNENTRVLEKRYLELGASITVLVKEGEGHYPSGPRDPQRVVDFLTKRAPLVASEGRSGGQYVKVNYPASTVPGELQVAVTYTLWIPDGVKQLRGIIVHQHGAGTTASIEGSTAPVCWQALAKKGLRAARRVTTCKTKIDLSPGASELWFDPRQGSDKRFFARCDSRRGRPCRSRDRSDEPWGTFRAAFGPM